MRYLKPTLMAFLACVLGACMGAPGRPGNAQASPAQDPVIAGEWQHHRVQFHYYGIITLYGCGGLEKNVRGLLLHFGARPDLNVRAVGCGGSNAPRHNAFVETDFYTLAPAGGSGDSVPAHWTERTLNPSRPSFIDNGDCELIEQMKGLIADSFTMRVMTYDTDCIPRIINGFSIRAQVLVALPAPNTAFVSPRQH